MIPQFQPISLCNTLYKLVSCIIVQRLKPHITHLINPCQAEFVLGRRMSDNIILVQEIIHTMMNKTGCNGYVALKLDLDKAYDRLEWPFIRESLEFFQVPPRLIMLIMSMVSLTQYHIQWNGILLPKLIPSKGVHQGDHLSLYLFILCLERFSILLEDGVRAKTIHPISFRGQVRISYLFFADDIFLFTKAKVRVCQNLNKILQKFCQCSGQIISTHKSRIWFSPNTPHNIKA